MNVLFEEFIGEFIKREFYESFNNISLQKSTEHFVSQKFVDDQRQGKAFPLRPDIVFYEKEGDSTPKLIIDTKYKLLSANETNEGFSQSDLYQMFAYSQKYRCSNIVMIYP